MPARPTNEPLNYFAVGLQSAKDVEATTFNFLKHMDGTGYQVEPDISREREGGDGQEVGLTYKTLIKSDGNIVVRARPQIAAQLLAWVLGSDTPTEIVAANVLTQHLGLIAATLPYLTIEQRYADEIERTTNVNLTGLEITWEPGQPIGLSAEFISGGTPYQRDVASTLTPAREAVKPFFYPGASVQVDGAASVKVQKGRIAIARNVDDGIQTTTLHREDVVPLNFDVDLDFTGKYEDRGLIQKVHYGGGSQVPIDLATGRFDLVTARGSHLMRVALPVFEYVGAAVNKLDPDGQTMWIDLSAMNIKNATHSIYSQVRNDATAAHV